MHEAMKINQYKSGNATAKNASMVSLSIVAIIRHRCRAIAHINVGL